MTQTHFAELIRRFGMRVEMEGLRPDEDGTLSLTIGGILLHLEVSSDGQLQLWSRLKDIRPNDLVLSRAMSLNFVLALQGSATIAHHSDADALVLVRTEPLAADAAGEWLETRIAAFLATYRLAEGLGTDAPRAQPEAAGAMDVFLRA